jgi:hypothetical protein
MNDSTSILNLRREKKREQDLGPARGFLDLYLPIWGMLSCLFDRHIPKRKGTAREGIITRWELGCEDWSATEVRDTVFRTSADKDGRLVYHYGVISLPLLNRKHSGPLDLIDNIAALWSHCYRLHSSPCIVLI